MKSRALKNVVAMALATLGFAMLPNTACAQGGWGPSASASSWGAGKSGKSETAAPQSVATGASSRWGAGQTSTARHPQAGGSSFAPGAAKTTAGSPAAGVPSHATAGGSSAATAGGSSLATVRGPAVPTVGVGSFSAPGFPTVATPTGLTHVGSAGRSGSLGSHARRMAGRATTGTLSAGNHSTMSARTVGGLYRVSAARGGAARRTSMTAGGGIGSHASGGDSGSNSSAGMHSPLPSDSILKSLASPAESGAISSELHTLTGESSSH